MAGMRKLERCEICQGRGRIKGVFHVLECAGCNGGGLVAPDGQPLAYPELVEQLRMRLALSGRQRRQNQQALERAGLWPLNGPADDYIGNNRRGPGGAHRTGD